MNTIKVFLCTTFTLITVDRNPAITSGIRSRTKLVHRKPIISLSKQDSRVRRPRSRPSCSPNAETGRRNRFNKTILNRACRSPISRKVRGRKEQFTIDATLIKIGRGSAAAMARRVNKPISASILTKRQELIDLWSSARARVHQPKSNSVWSVITGSFHPR